MFSQPGRLPAAALTSRTRAPRARAGFSQGVAHLAAGTVAKKAHGVDGLAGSAGGDEDGFAEQVLWGSENMHDACGDGCGRREASAADHAAGQIAAFGLDDVDAALAQDRHVGAGGRMIPHIDVHGGRDEDRGRGGEVDGGDKVVREAVGHFGQAMRGGGADDERVDALSEADVLDGNVGSGLFAGLPKRLQDGAAGESGEGKGANELLGCWRHRDLDGDAAALQFAHDLGGLVGGDAPGNGDEHPHAPGSSSRLSIRRVDPA